MLKGHVRHLITIIFFHLLTISAWGQPDSCWTVLVIEKGNELKSKLDMGAFSRTGFYLYRNCVYEIDLKNKKSISGRLIDIKPDTLFFTNFFNGMVAYKAQSRLDTIAVYYKDLSRLNLIADRSFGYYERHYFDNFSFIFKKDTGNCILPSEWYEIFSNDQRKYELVPHMTAQGINLLFEESGRPCYFYGTGMVKPDRSKMDDTYDKRNIFWFTPCNVEEVNGLALGLFTENIKNDPYNEKDSLKVNGLNLEISIMRLAALPAMHYSGPFPDSLEFYDEYIRKNLELKINGVNISLFGTINEAKINGLNIGGLNTVVDHINGLSISGLNNFSYIMNGVTIAAIRNRATKGKGVQIGLFNKCNDLRGFQIGLWNTNGKRSLPFINWQFRPTKKK